MTMCKIMDTHEGKGKGKIHLQFPRVLASHGCFEEDKKVHIKISRKAVQANNYHKLEQEMPPKKALQRSFGHLLC